MNKIVFFVSICGHICFLAYASQGESISKASTSSIYEKKNVSRDELYADFELRIKDKLRSLGVDNFDIYVGENFMIRRPTVDLKNAKEYKAKNEKLIKDSLLVLVNNGAGQQSIRLTCRLVGDEGYLDIISIAKELQRRGLGSFLAKLAEEFILSGGGKKIDVVNKGTLFGGSDEDNEIFWRKLGYTHKTGFGKHNFIKYIGDFQV